MNDDGRPCDDPTSVTITVHFITEWQLVAYMLQAMNESRTGANLAERLCSSEFVAEVSGH